MKIRISATIESIIEQVWAGRTTPEHIVQWNFAAADWCCPGVANNLAVGGEFSDRMEAKDGLMAFDFEGVFTEIVTKCQAENILCAVGSG